MSESIHRHQLTHQMDKYLDFHEHSQEAMRHVIGVLNQFDRIVSIATQSALGQLTVPQYEFEATVIAFPRFDDDPTAA